jgi:hypothetical protein
MLCTIHDSKDHRRHKSYLRALQKIVFMHKLMGVFCFYTPSTLSRQSRRHCGRPLCSVIETTAVHNPELLTGPGQAKRDEQSEALTTDFWFFADLRDGVRVSKQPKQKYPLLGSGLSTLVLLGIRQRLFAAFAFGRYVP